MSDRPRFYESAFAPVSSSSGASEWDKCPTCTATNGDKENDHDSNCELTALRRAAAASEDEEAAGGCSSEVERLTKEAEEIRAAELRSRVKWEEARAAQVRAESALALADALAEAADGLLAFIRSRYPQDFASDGAGYRCVHHLELAASLAAFRAARGTR